MPEAFSRASFQRRLVSVCDCKDSTKMFICKKGSDKTGNYQSKDEVVSCFASEPGAIKAIYLKKETGAGGVR